MHFCLVAIFVLCTVSVSTNASSLSKGKGSDTVEVVIDVEPKPIKEGSLDVVATPSVSDVDDTDSSAMEERQACRRICQQHCVYQGVTRCRNVCRQRCVVGDEEQNSTTTISTSQGSTENSTTTIASNTTKTFTTTTMSSTAKMGSTSTSTPSKPKKAEYEILAVVQQSRPTKAWPFIGGSGVVIFEDEQDHLDSDQGDLQDHYGSQGSPVTDDEDFVM